MSFTAFSYVCVCYFPLSFLICPGVLPGLPLLGGPLLHTQKFHLLLSCVPFPPLFPTPFRPTPLLSQSLSTPMSLVHIKI